MRSMRRIAGLVAVAATSLVITMGTAQAGGGSSPLTQLIPALPTAGLPVVGALPVGSLLPVGK